MPGFRPSRRELLQAAALSAASTRLQAVAAETPTPPVAEVFLDLDRIHKWDNSHGDTWDPFWADDDNLYAFNCDGRGFGTAHRNLAFNRLSGDSMQTLTGASVNPMDEYGKSGQKESDNATWKACGQECIDSVFYAFVSRNVYGKDSGDYWLRQTATNSSLIKSTDRGLTWTRTAAENYRDPMWPGAAFGAPFFVHYGKNGGSSLQDGAGRYVYAVSTNGFWNDGDRYILGRVPRSRIAALRASDWTYFTGGDGADPARWSPQIANAAPLLDLRTHCGQTPPCFISSLGVYLMVVWYNTEKMTRWFEPNQMRYDFYQSPHPWGPWTALNSSFTDGFLGTGHWYGPSLCAKFQRRVGRDVEIVMFTSGCPFPDVPTGLYKAWAIPLILRTSPPPASTLIPADDQRIVYSGKWTAPGDSAELKFNGSGVECLADKNAGFGTADILLDGRVARTVSFDVQDFPRLRSVVVYHSPDLPRGPHTVRVVSKSAGPIALAGFRVW